RRHCFVQETRMRRANPSRAVTTTSLPSLKKNDDLAQWRGYGGSGPRFTVGFRKSELTELYAQCGMKLAEVDYDHDTCKKKMQVDFLHGIAPLDQKWIASGKYTDPTAIHPPDIQHLNAGIVEAVSPLLKHRAFKAAAEWRLYTVPPASRPTTWFRV